MRPFATLRHRVKSWWALGFGEKVELLLILVLALAAEVAVKVFPLPRLTSALGIALSNQEIEPDDAGRPEGSRMSRATVERRARAVDRVYRHWPRKRSCLRRALVLGYRIRAARPTLWLGVARANDEIRAHAWITVQGEVVGSERGDWAPLGAHQTAG